MFDAQRGQVRHLARHGQLLDGSGLDLPRKITHTDIDALYDFGREELFVFCEIKLRGKDVPYGQRIALHRVARLASCVDPKTGFAYAAVLLVLDHDVHDTSEPVMMKDCVVRSCDVYYKGDADCTEYTAVGKTLNHALEEMLAMRRSALEKSNVFG